MDLIVFGNIQTDRLPSQTNLSEITWVVKTIHSDLFRLCPPRLAGAHYLQPPDQRAMFLHNNLVCNGTSSVNGGCIKYWGGTNEKYPLILTSHTPVVDLYTVFAPKTSVIVVSHEFLRRIALHRL